MNNKSVGTAAKITDLSSESSQKKKHLPGQEGESTMNPTFNNAAYTHGNPKMRRVGTSSKRLSIIPTNVRWYFSRPYSALPTTAPLQPPTPPPPPPPSPKPTPPTHREVTACHHFGRSWSRLRPNVRSTPKSVLSENSPKHDSTK